MSTITVISPSKIKEGDAQNITADLTRFDLAKSAQQSIIAHLSTFLKIEDEATATNALQAAKDANETIKAIDEKKEQLYRPFKNACDAISKYHKDLTTPITEKINAVKSAVLKFQQEEKKRQHQAMVTARQGQLAQLGFSFDGNSGAFVREGIGSVTNREVENTEAPVWNNLIASYTEQITRINSQQAAQLTEEMELLEAFGTDEEVKEVKETAEKLQAPVEAPAPVTMGSSFQAKGTTKRWVFEVKDTAQVPREYLIVNETAIRKAIANGVREIPGVEIKQEESISLV